MAVRTGQFRTEPSQAQGRTDRQFREDDRPRARRITRSHHGRQHVSRAGEGTRTGDGVVDRVQARGADLVHVPLFHALQPDDHVVEVCQQFVRSQVDVGQSADGRAQSAHGGRGLDAAADHVTHHEGDTGSGKRDHVVPVTAHTRPGSAGQVAGGCLDGGLLRHVLRQQAVLEGERGRTLLCVATGVVDVHSCSGRDRLGQEQVVVVEGVSRLTAEELREPQRVSTGPQRNQEHGENAVAASGAAVVRGHLQPRGHVVWRDAEAEGCPLASTAAGSDPSG